MSEDQDSNPQDGKLSDPEILQPRAIQILTPEERQKRKKSWVITGVSALFLVEFLLWALNQYFSLRGVVHVAASRIILASMWPVGILLAWVIVWPIQMRHRWKALIVVSIAILLGFGLVRLDVWTLKLAEQAPPTKDELLQVSATANVGTPPIGMTGSIQWMPQYTYIRILLNDPGSTDFDNLDMTVGFDIAIAAMEQTSKLPGVTTFADVPLRTLSATVTIVDKDGKKINIPAYSSGISSSSTYRIRCEHVPRRGIIELVAAGVVLKFPNGFSAFEENKEYGTKRLPTVLNITGSYRVGSKLVNFSNKLKLSPFP